MIPRLISLASAAALTLCLPTAAQIQTVFAVHDLGVLPGYLDSHAYGINEGGQVVGDSYDPVTNTRHAFRWEAGVMTDLGTLPGGRDATAFDINETGKVAGTSDFSPNIFSTYEQGFLEDGGMGKLHALRDRAARAHALNDAGQVAGQGLFELSKPSTAAVWVGAPLPVNLGGLMVDGGSEAFGINNNGWVVGDAWIFDGFGLYNHAFVWNGAAMLDLGTLHGTSNFSRALDINDANTVVGWIDNSSANWRHAFAWTAGVQVDLGVHPVNGTLSVANAINENGWIVGSGNTSDPNWHALFWQSGSPVDLNDYIFPKNHGWTIVSAEDVNDAGQIVGYGYPPGVQSQHACLLTPVFPIPLPPPGTITLPKHFSL